MANALQLGNQKCLINFDEYFQIRDIFYPYVGEENHLFGHVHRFGVFVDDKLWWTTDQSFTLSVAYEALTLVGAIKITNHDLGLEINVRNCVHSDQTCYIADFEIINLRSNARTIKVFFRNDFHIYGHTIGDTAYFEPNDKALIHYKGRRYFWMNASINGQWGWHDWACGRSDLGAGISTSIDAEDGQLSKNPVAHGRVDSTGGLEFTIQSQASQKFTHSIVLAQDLRELSTTLHWLFSQSPDNLFSQTIDWTNQICARAKRPYDQVDEPLRSQYYRSILTILNQSDQNGAIIAACDSHFLHGYDTYSYCWPRDGAFISAAMIEAGIYDLPKNFFEFCASVRTDDGYLLQKYNADGSYGSSWHPWVGEHNEPILPIQEDSTATVLWAIGLYGEKTNDIAWLAKIWELFVKDAAGFLVEFRDSTLKLPSPTWDLWEERRGILTFTTCSVIAGLEKSAMIAQKIEDHTKAELFAHVAHEMKESLLIHLFDQTEKSFIQMITHDHDQLTKTVAVDSSLLAPFIFDVLPSSHPKVELTVKKITEQLSIHGTGGLARYMHDRYFQIRQDFPGNPWVITTMWLAQWYIRQGQIDQAEEFLHWAVKLQSSAGFLPEQFDPVDGRHLSVSPLTWSHGEYVRTFLMWMKAKYS